MIFSRFFPVASCLVLGLGTLSALEPGNRLNELMQLEAKVEDVATKSLPSTVALLSEKTGSSGSGVIADENGLILTAAHVVQGADEVLVVFTDGKQVRGEVLGANYSKDIAMVRIIDKGNWPAVELGKSKSLKAGDWVVALGHSAGFDAARTPPVRFGRIISKGPGNYLTTDCTLIGGDSGGPLFDIDGRLIAIHSSIGRSLKNNNHAGIDGFREDWSRLLKGETWGRLSLNPFANPDMPVLGIGMGAARGIQGVVVRSMDRGSPAAAAGLRIGDLIRGIAGSPVRDGRDLLRILAKHQAGETIGISVLRGRRTIDLDITLKRRGELYDEP